jgi:hypothetical protein
MGRKSISVAFMDVQFTVVSTNGNADQHIEMGIIWIIEIVITQNNIALGIPP